MHRLLQRTRACIDYCRGSCAWINYMLLVTDVLSVNCVDCTGETTLVNRFRRAACHNTPITADV